MNSGMRRGHTGPGPNKQNVKAHEDGYDVSIKCLSFQTLECWKVS